MQRMELNQKDKHHGQYKLPLKTYVVFTSSLSRHMIADVYESITADLQCGRNHMTIALFIVGGRSIRIVYRAPVNFPQPTASPVDDEVIRSGLFLPPLQRVPARQPVLIKTRRRRNVTIQNACATRYTLTPSEKATPAMP